MDYYLIFELLLISYLPIVLLISVLFDIQPITSALWPLFPIIYSVLIVKKIITKRREKNKNYVENEFPYKFLINL